MAERLLCSICLEVYSDPVCTPCGHNFCQICLNTYWNNSQDCRCPNCNKEFKPRPDLKINTTLRDVVDEHKKKCHEEQAEVVCDICSEGKLKAVKSCLVCQSSYCETHLEPHLRVSGLQKHKRIDPVKNLQDYICPKHDRPLGLFCRDDHTCVCLICTVTDHKYHNTVPLRESELQEMMKERQRGAETHDEYVIKYLEQEISELKKRNIELELIAENQRAAETQDKCLIKDLKKEITQLKMRNIELEMKIEMQKASEKKYEDVIKHLNREIAELKKRNIELLEMMEEEQREAEKHDEDVIKDLKQEITELKSRNRELEMIAEEQRATEKQDKHLIKDLERAISQIKWRNNELEMTGENWRAAEKLDKDLIRDQKKEIAELKMRDAELVVVKQKQITSENVIKVRDQEIIELKKRNTELKKRDAELKMRDTELKMRDTELKMRDAELKKRDAELVMEKQKQITSENVIKVLDQEITELKKRNTELVMVKQKQITAENVIKVRDQEITELKKRNTEQQQKISNAENNLLLLQEKHQKDLSRLQNSSSGCSCMFWLLVVSVGVFLGLFAAAVHKDTQQRGAVLKWMQQYAVDVTLDPDTANPYLILSDDKKQVRHGDTPLNLPNYWTRFDRYFNVLGKEGFSSGGFYFEVQVTGKTGWFIGVARESVDRKGDLEMTAVNGFWTVRMKSENDYVACVDADVSLSLIMSPQKVGVFVDYKAGKVSFYDAECGYHIYSFFGQYFTGKLFPVFNPCGNGEGRNSKPLIITPIKEMTHDISSIVNIKFVKMCKCMKKSIFY
ncbi:centrosomal protein of 290 kDa-like isoform X2 [Triplophysa rosa]|nr:centrosomal protein of 290 kDa-like isoform X2 [Triplophysa rosa]XP_057211580.1 centrosomal protein of 290 kDa-like isoform X2 [Triplophysa rosa]